ncbi:glycosyltransferase family 4 protein [Pseudalkalibacillus salsuginis]|uniref:glycosyltransferase family 4 protein n=1 Tax=Pseudalkalibacillus salsuginis TaxID=2910972 RepID=UPI001F167F8D|nr:glycosyltransferase family 4 protein [Pseudalkalibacillus salsuginis]MCF6410131.1 glycosyltransferase family 4 protein [Pseudalkalibacillus salsuginis]
MRIILLSENFPPEVGAPQIRLYEVGKELIARGHQVEVLTAFPHHPHGEIPEEYKGKFYEFEHYDGIPVHRTWIYPSPKGSFIRRLASYFSFTLSALYSVFKAKPADVIICTSPPLFLGITGYIASKLKRAKFIFNVADIWPESAVELGILKNKACIRFAEKLEQFLYKKAWKIATATEGIKEYMIKQGKKEEDVFLLPNGVNTDQFSPGEENKERLQSLDLTDKKVFTFAGRMGYAQALDSVLKAAELVQKRGMTHIAFLFIGDGPEKKKIIEMAKEMELRNVIFHDPVPVSEMPDLYSITDFSLVTLKNIDLFKGARPSKIFPALSSGVPVIFSGVGESEVLLTQNKCGIITEPENPENLAETVIQCAAMSKEEYEELSWNGRRFVEREYSWRSIVDDLEENLKEETVEILESC